MRALAGVTAALILFVFFLTSRPMGYRVERKRALAVPADQVFAVLTDLKKLPAIVVQFGESLPRGVLRGDVYAWKSGSITLGERIPNQKVVVKLAYTAPMESKADWTVGLAPAPLGTDVTWVSEGNHNLLGRALALVMDLDKAVGADLEQCLDRLKSAAEAKPPP